MSKDFLLEIGLEEMPAKYVTSSVLQLEKRVTDWLKDNQIEFKEIKTYSTPRRLTVLVEEMAEEQANRVEEAKGTQKNRSRRRRQLVKSIRVCKKSKSCARRFNFPRN
ncbi:hypothetical protein GCM10027614_83390 [Micromonospora vulcania]